VPVVTVIGHPAGAVRATTASISWAGSAGSGSPAAFTYTCQIDGNGRRCTSPLTLTGLSQGSHTVTIVAVDAAGHVSAPQTVSWLVDTVAPVLTVTVRPAATTASSAATLRWTATDPGRPAAPLSYRCALDGAAPVACTSPLTVTSLRPGRHVVSVTVTDDAGNTSRLATVTWVVTAPRRWSGPPSNGTRPAGWGSLPRPRPSRW
jgi:hypothetical protein